MNLSKTISVDPGKMTLGELHHEADNGFVRKATSTIANTASPLPRAKTTRNFLFACSMPTANQYGGRMLMVRWMMGALLVVSGSLILSGNIASPQVITEPGAFAVGEIVCGAMLALGLLTRVAMSAAAIVFCAMTVESVTNGIFSMQDFMCLLASVIFLIMGAGKFSCDFLIRKALVRRSVRRRRQRRNRPLTYKAFAQDNNDW